MKTPFRVASLVLGATIVAAACTGAATPTPSTVTTPAPGASEAPATEAPLSGELTVWHAYGSSGGGAEFKAFSRLIERF
ncbi:MAG: hypothetical protein AABZ33_11815 [Chloroflexota bacterium]